MTHGFAHLHIFSLQMSKVHLPKGKLAFICLVCELDFGGRGWFGISILWITCGNFLSVSYIEEFDYHCLSISPNQYKAIVSLFCKLRYIEYLEYFYGSVMMEWSLIIKWEDCEILQLWGIRFKNFSSQEILKLKWNSKYRPDLSLWKLTKTLLWALWLRGPFRSSSEPGVSPSVMRRTGPRWHAHRSPCPLLYHTQDNQDPVPKGNCLREV